VTVVLPLVAHLCPTGDMRLRTRVRRSAQPDGPGDERPNGDRSVTLRTALCRWVHALILPLK
jgi:hypothetical protein